MPGAALATRSKTTRFLAVQARIGDHRCFFMFPPWWSGRPARLPRPHPAVLSFAHLASQSDSSSLCDGLSLHWKDGSSKCPSLVTASFYNWPAVAEGGLSRHRNGSAGEEACSVFEAR